MIALDVSVSFEFVRFGFVRFGFVRFGFIRFGFVRFGFVRFGFVRLFVRDGFRLLVRVRSNMFWSNVI